MKNRFLVLFIGIASAVLSGCPQPETLIKPVGIQAMPPLFAMTNSLRANEMFGQFPVHLPTGNLVIGSPTIGIHVHRKRITVNWIIENTEGDLFLVDLKNTALLRDDGTRLEAKGARIFDLTSKEFLLEADSSDQLSAQVRLRQGTNSLQLVYWAEVPIKNFEFKARLVLQDKTNRLESVWKCQKQR